jgi:predicted small metal-binding protein
MALEQFGLDARYKEPSREHDEKATEMRAIDCPCGHRLEASEDEELFRAARDHVDRDHPEMERSDDELRARVAADAYDVESSPRP